MKKCMYVAFILCLLNLPVFAGQGSINIPAPLTTYNLAQTVKWINDDIFAVGRWDGTISLFREPNGAREYGPVIIQSFTTPGRKGIEMLQKIGKTFVVSSNNSRSMAVWKIHDNILILEDILQYDQKLGTANAGAGLFIDEKLQFIAGHENGYISQWEYDGDVFKNIRVVNVRTNAAPANPFNLYNIRSVVAFQKDLVILASEDGDLSIYKVSSGEVLKRKRYNDAAKRGINSISYENGYLLVGNCSVGADDKNLWLYKISENSIEMVDAVNLKKDASLEQVFDFDVKLLRRHGKMYFYASTGEGLIWLGEVANEHLNPLDNAIVSAEGGAAIDIDPDEKNIAAVSNAIRLFPCIKDTEKGKAEEVVSTNFEKKRGDVQTSLTTRPK
jgi:WD40 repeat protein